jgi:tRNA 2-selenouridine synthase
MTANKLQPSEFLALARTRPVIDVRSPKEFAQGHIPGAFSIPLFSDEERARVGTTYTRKGNREAIAIGLEIVGPKLGSFVELARKLAPGEELLVHCWRGGMRSEAMAWLFNFAGMKAMLMDGGYKTYRRFIRKSFETGPELKVLGGMTGSGKTEMLRRMEADGEQVIDLEGLAHHKGSAFGWLGQGAQPTTEQFENNLAERWLSMDPSRPVWVEDESLNIGKVLIPEVFFKRMRSAELHLLEVPFETRVRRLVQEYGDFDREVLVSVIGHISRRMGSDRAKLASEALMSCDLQKAVEIVLKYYDETYRYSLSQREARPFLKQPDKEVDPRHD